MSKHYFVTGATGAVGSALLPLLLEDEENRIWLLMRADSNDHLQQRLDKLIAYWGLNTEQNKEDLKRIIPIQGDTDKENFALTTELYTELSRKITHIIHCAGVVKMNLPLDVARQHALGATKTIVDLALQCQASGQLQKIEFVSTVGVGGRLPGVLPETWITQARSFHNTYEQAKAEAEDYLFEQIKTYSLPITVHRPSMVVGDSRTGSIIHFQIFYHICEFLSGRRTVGLLPNVGNAGLDTVPVDYVAAVLMWSSESQDSIGKIFHLCSGVDDMVKLKELQTMARDNMQIHGLRLPRVISLPPALFNGIIKLISPLLNKRMKRAVKSFPFFLDYLADEQGFSNTDTIRFLHKKSEILMPARDSYLNAVINYCVEKQNSAHTKYNE